MRNHGLDLLRMVSMLMVAVLHVLGQGGVMVHLSENGATYYTCYFLEAACLCAVNCYGLLSGYVGVYSSFKPRKLLEMILTVELYSVGIALVLGLFHPDWITRDELLKVILPIQWKAYWYYSAYVALFLLMPFLNRGIRALSDREKADLLGVLFLVFSVFTMFAKTYASDFLALVGGYSLIWLLILYTFGAALRELEESHRRSADVQKLDASGVSPADDLIGNDSNFATPSGRGWVDRLLGLGKLSLFMIFLLSAGLGWLWKLLVEQNVIKAPADTTLARMLLTYTSPTILICGLCLLLLFRQIRIRKEWCRRIIALLAPSAFYVYIIHTHPLIWEHILKGAFTRWRTLHPVLVLLPVLGTALAIYASCTALDVLRRRVYRLINRRNKSEQAA